MKLLPPTQPGMVLKWGLGPKGTLYLVLTSARIGEHIHMDIIDSSGWLLENYMIDVKRWPSWWQIL